MKHTSHKTHDEAYSALIFSLSVCKEDSSDAVGSWLCPSAKAVMPLAQEWPMYQSLHLKAATIKTVVFAFVQIPPYLVSV